MTDNQAPRAIMMVRPTHFAYNEETAASNAFQQAQGKDNIEAIRAAANLEFDGAVQEMRQNHIEVIDFTPDDDLETTDEVFPNNWVSFHHDGKVIIYPMMAASRRAERRMDFITALDKQYGFVVSEIIDLSHYEGQGLFLEGTGSMVIDYQHNICYANLSPRTHLELLEKVCKFLGYQLCHFRAIDQSGQDIYHTNVLMCVANEYAVVCLNAIPHEADRNRLVDLLEESGHEVVDIDYSQMMAFAGNMMEVQDQKGASVIVMSQSARESLTANQVSTIQQYSKIVSLQIPTIEKYGGGSVRCMMAGIFLIRD